MVTGSQRRRNKKGSNNREGKKEEKTPTQLRNARKRRKAKLDKKGGNKRATTNAGDDPSLRYLSNPTAAPVIQQSNTFFQEQGHTFEVKVGPTSGWRTVSKLAVRSQSGVLCIGLFAPGSHDLLSIPECQAHHPRINSAIRVIQKQCRKAAIQPYNEQTGTGSLKYIAINIERSTGNQQVTLVWNQNKNQDDNEAPKLQQLCEALVKVSKNNDDRLVLHSLWVHYSYSNKYSNSIFDREGKWELKYGDKMVIEHLSIEGVSKVPLHFPPQVFRQANIDAFTNIVAEIRLWFQNKCRPGKCLELYGGVGTIGLHIADLCDSFVSSDENPFNKKCFEQSVDAMQRKIPYESKNAVDMTDTRAFAESNTIIVDPPRKGLDTEVADALCNQEKLRSLVYVSCGFPAFQRDFEVLTTKGKWKLDHAEGHVLFPGSDAIETLAFFSR